MVYFYPEYDKYEPQHVLQSEAERVDDSEEIKKEVDDSKYPDYQRMLEQSLMNALHRLCVICYEDSRKNGWWDEKIETKDAEMAQIATKIALMHSELSEALEAIRTSAQHDDPHFAEELADCVIRICDLCGAFQIDLGDALIEKLKKNRTRGYKHGGKAI